MSIEKTAVLSIEPLNFPAKTLDPFLFCVYHVDNYPAGDSNMRAPRHGNGADFNPNAPYRMYHGDDIPGFPQHPHRGFETITATIKGIIDHTDSLGSAGRYGHGDLQWMTAGKGVVHGEMFPLVHDDKPNPTKFFQIWLNLPKKDKMVEPSYVMHWNEQIPRFILADQSVKITVWAGELEGLRGLPSPPHSYGSDPKSELAVLFFELAPGATYRLAAANGGDVINRRIYFLEGSGLKVDSQSMRPKSEITLRASQSVELTNSGQEVTEVLLLQGKPIGEPVAQHGPFVMNTQQEIQQAFADYRRTQFGGWPWPQDAMVFPREKGRFALMDGQETKPPTINEEL